MPLWLTVVISLMTVVSAFADADPVIRSWQTDQGLPSDKVNTLAQTPDGYLWVGTSGGLARFDGARFVSYGPKEGIPGVNIQELLSDREGRLWIVTSGAGIFWMRDGVFTKVQESDGLPTGVSSLV